MSESVTPAANPYAVPLAALEQQARVPLDEQVAGRSSGVDSSAAWAWDEQRRQAQLAGGA